MSANEAAAASDEELREVLAEVRRLAVFTRRRAASAIAGSYKSAFKGSGIEFEQVREYVEGDDPRSVDWNVTARMGRPFVKTYSDERDRLVLFAVDVDPRLDAGFGWSSSRRAAASVVALIALTAVDLGDRVGAVHFADGFQRWAKVGRGTAHALRVVRDTLILRPTERSGPRGGGFSEAVDLCTRSVRRHAILFVVADACSPLDARVLARAARKHEVVVVDIVPAELEPGRLVGRVRLVDASTGRTAVVDTTDSHQRAELTRRCVERSRERRTICERSGAQFVEVAIPFERDPVGMLQPLVELFHRREGRGGRR